MKINKFMSSTRSALLASAFTIFAAGAVHTHANAQQPTQQPAQQLYTISGDASGSQVVPGVQGNGIGNFKGTFDPATRELKYTTTWDKLSAAPNSAGFYTGAAGSSGKAVGDTWMLGSNLTPTGTYTGKMTLTEAQAKDLLAGNWYYSYGTTTNAAGEVRGQISATPGDQ